IPVRMAGNERKPWKTRGLCASPVPYSGIHLGNPALNEDLVFLIRLFDSDLSVFDHVSLGLQGQRTLRRDREGGFEDLPVAGAARFRAGDDHFDHVPVAVLVLPQRLVGADPRVVADLELMPEHLIT